MRITWYGHAAFAIEGRNSAGEPRKVILDPYNYPLCGGYLPINESADIVSVSHDNRKYHSDISAVQGAPEVIEGLRIAGREQTARGVTFRAFEVYENDAGEGPNAMVKFTLDDLTVAHQGDLGHALTGGALEFLRGVDVLLALAGGPPTIALDDLAAHISELHTPLVFPMHYKTPKVNLNLQPVEAFLALCADFEVVRPGGSTYEINRAELPQATRVVVLEHAR